MINAFDSEYFIKSLTKSIINFPKYAKTIDSFIKKSVNGGANKFVVKGIIEKHNDDDPMYRIFINQTGKIEIVSYKYSQFQNWPLDKNDLVSIHSYETEPYSLFKGLNENRSLSSIEVLDEHRHKIKMEEILPYMENSISKISENIEEPKIFIELPDNFTQIDSDLYPTLSKVLQ